MTYARGHKAVMNTHSIGGNTERTRYMGMDKYGNKYYEDFDAVRNHLHLGRPQPEEMGRVQ